eukprot:gene9982-12236_t
MGWIRPRQITFKKAWMTIDENDYFVLLQRIKTIPLFNEVVTLINETNHDAYMISDYKIALKNKYGHMIGGSNDFNEIQSMWQWIMDNVIPSVNQMNKNDIQEIFEFLALKFTCLGIQDENIKEQEKEKEYKDKTVLKREKSFKKKFQLENEKLISQYSCTLAQKHGCMYISENYISFYSRIFPTKISIPFIDIVDMKKSAHSSPLKLLLVNSIKIQTEQKELVFHTFFKIDETFQLLDQLWKFTMNRMLVNAELAHSSSNSNIGIISANNTGSIINNYNSSSENLLSHSNSISKLSNSITINNNNNGNSGQNSLRSSGSFYIPHTASSPSNPYSLENNHTSHSFGSSSSNPLTISGISHFFNNNSNYPQTPTSNSTSFSPIYQSPDYCFNEDYQSLFTLPPSEHLIDEFQVSLWMNQQDIPGKVYLSNNFICFESTDIQFVIPFKEIQSISNEKSIGSRGNTMKICCLRKQQKFYFFSSQIDSKYDLIRQIWTELKQQSVSGIPPHDYERTSFQSIGLTKEILSDPREFTTNYERKQSIQNQLWEQYLTFNGDSVTMVKTDELKNLIRGGVPDHLRRKIWMITSGALYKSYCYPSDYYQQLVQSHQNEQNASTDDIEKDLHRSYPKHPFFKEKEGLDKLRNILTAYSWRNPSIGYCQSMNIVVAIFLLFLDEEDAFWLLATLCEDIAPDYYRPGMVGSIADEKTFENLLCIYMSDVDSHLKKINCPLSIAILPWLLCLYIGYVQMELSLRVLDCIFYEGINILFQVGLAMFKVNRDSILACNNAEEVLLLLKTTHYEIEQLLNVSFQEFDNLPTDKIEQLRNSNKFLAIKNIQVSNKKSKIREWIDRYNLNRIDAERIYDYFQSSLSLNTSKLGIGRSKFNEICKDILPTPWRSRSDLISLIFRVIDEDMDELITIDEFIH